MITRLIIIAVVLFLGGFCIGALIGLKTNEKEELLKKGKKRMKIEEIKIKESFLATPPKKQKMRDKWNFYRHYGELESRIVVDRQGYLVNGYTSYIIAKEDGIKDVEVRVI